MAARKTIGFETVRAMGLALPDVAAGTAYGSPALKVGGKMFACVAIHRSAEPDTLALRLDFEQRDELIREDPGTYYLTDHYVDHPVVLVRLTRVHPDALRDLLLTARRFVSAGNRRATPRKPKPSRRRGRSS